jgi:putative transposase
MTNTTSKQQTRSPYPSDLSDSEWATVQPYIETPQTGRGRPRTVDLREIVNALLYMKRTSCTWDMLPHDFPPSETVYYYFRKWSRNGVMQQIEHLLRRKSDENMVQ